MVDFQRGLVSWLSCVTIEIDGDGVAGTERGHAVEDRRGAPFYGFVEMQPGPSSDEFFFRHEWVPVAGSGGQVSLVDSAFVQAMREGWVVMIDEVNTAIEVILGS